MDQKVNAERLVGFLYDDLPHVFDDQGIDRTAYDELLKFRDPITKLDTLSGFLFNIALLKTLFRPELQLHWVKQVCLAMILVIVCVKNKVNGCVDLMGLLAKKLYEYFCSADNNEDDVA